MCFQVIGLGGEGVGGNTNTWHSQFYGKILVNGLVQPMMRRIHVLST